MQSMRNRGGTIEDILFDNITLDGITQQVIDPTYIYIRLCCDCSLLLVSKSIYIYIYIYIYDDLPRQAQDNDAVDSKSSERKRGHYCAFFSSVVAAGQHRSILHLREAGKKTPFLRHFVLKTPSFYQDRLGTNIGKALKKNGVSL
jgi:hypothetical protein